MQGRNQQKDALISGPFRMEMADPRTVEIEYAHTSRSSQVFSDCMNIYLKEASGANLCDTNPWVLFNSACGDSLTTIPDQTTYFFPGENDWTTLKISDFDYDKFYIKIEGINDFGNNLYVRSLDVIYSTLSSVEDLGSKPTSWSLFPNPVGQNLQIESKEEWVALSIYGSDGRLLKSENSEPFVNYDLDVSDLNSGVYLLVLTNSKGSSESQKFIKE
ncbi:T9SS type A sorting domain-containing protein [bacterium SCSIO 12741]|nr:T9SS type A sorting domain-containing protein [bacterium SCSIO 12741]